AFETFLSTNLQVMRQMLKVISERQADYNLLMQKDRPTEETVTHGKIITIFSPKGGVGRSTVAVNLAAQIKQASNRTVCLVDASLFFGDVGVLMNLDNRTSIADLLPHVNEFDPEILEDVLATHPGGVKVLLAPPKPEMAEL